MHTRGRQSFLTTGDAKREDEFDFKKLYAYYDRGRKAVADYLREYQYISNYKYYKGLSNRLDHRYRLMDIYDYTMQDLHLTSIINTLFHHILGERYFIANPDGEKDLNATKLIKYGWFVNLVKEILYSKLYGYSMIELGDYDKKRGTLKGIESIERRNVAPGDNLILEYPDDVSGWDITEDRFRGDYVLIDGNEGFGWLLKAAPIVMSKRFAISSHTANAEVYGIPLVHGKTVMDDTADKQRLANEIAASRDQRIIITGIDDEIDIKEQISNDTNKIYTELVRITNDELTKLILSQTATTDQQSYVGAAQIQYQIYQGHVQAIREFVVNVINEEILWRLREKGLKIPEDYQFTYTKEIEVSPETLNDIFKNLLDHYEVDPEEIERHFGIKVGRQILEEQNDSLFESGEAGANEVNFLETTPSKVAAKTSDLIASQVAAMGSKTLKKNVLVNKLIQLYEPKCGHTHCSRKLLETMAESDESDTYQEALAPLLLKLLEGDEVITDPELVLINAQQLVEAAGFGIDQDFSDLDLDDPANEYLRSIWDHVWGFAAVKQYHFLRELASIKNQFADAPNVFRSEANKLNRLFNKTFAITEYEHVQHALSVAGIWRGIGDNDTILEYITVGDDRVRDNHRLLEGVRRRKSDSFWDAFMPPWEYGCRCTVIDTGTTDGRTINKDRKIPDESVVPKEFRNNVGETGIVFGKSHPFFQVPEGHLDRIRKSIAEAQNLL